MREKRECPQCGAAVYSTDDVCMSCGASLVQPTQPAEEKPTAPVTQPAAPTLSAAPQPRPISQVSMPSRIVGAVGGFWNIFPWIALVAIVALPFAAMFGVTALAGVVGSESTLPALLYIAAIGLSGLVGLALTFWVIVDVLDQQAGIWWIFVILLLCGPIGLLMYLLMARE